MKYYYQYDVCAVFITVALIIIYMIRARYLSKSNKVFITIIICDGIAAFFDAISCFTISFPRSYPLAFNYIVSLGYLILYNMMGLLYFIYIYLKSGYKKYDKIIKAAIVLLFLMYIFTIGSSPWTHLVAYFDNNLNYCHGPFMKYLFIFPFITFIWELVLFFEARENFNIYQLLVSMGLIISMGITVGITIIFPKMLIGQFIMAVIMIFVYITYEDPAYYSYMDTLCLNKKALLNDLSYKRKTDMVIIELNELNYIEQNFEFDIIDTYKKKIADKLSMSFRNNIYNVSDSIFVLLTDLNTNNSSNILDKISKVEASFSTISKNKPITLSTYVVHDITKYSTKELELFTQFLREDIETYESGKRKLCEYNNKIKRKNDILHAIETAIQNDSFEVYYQPLFDIKQNKYTAAEALIRLFDNNIGFVDPEEMIILAEKNGYINQIGDIIFEKVCKFISSNNLKESGVNTIDINLSPKQCTQNNLATKFRSLMTKYNVDSSQIIIEVTETAENRFSKLEKDNIYSLTDLGIQIALDDYGSGYASPYYLFEIPFSIVKIDKEILWGAMKDDNAMIILKHMIAMIKSLDKKIVVEGVENNDMVEILNQEDCDYYQGYHYSKPLTEVDFLNFINNYNLKKHE